jgi:competence protein ComEC
MPRPVILFTAVYWAGLATGLLRFGEPVWVYVLAVGAAVWGRGWGLLVGAALLAGRLGGELAVHLERAQCAAQIPEGRIRLWVRVLDPVDAGGGRITLAPDAACRGHFSARWPRGQAVEAGARAEVSGYWMPRPGLGGRPGGTLAVTQTVVTPGQASLSERLHNHLYAASHRLYGTRAGMVDALILGRRGAIDADLQDRFARSGLVHLLSISGFHVGLITAWVFLLCRLARAGRTRSLAIAATTSAAYVAFLGWPAPAARAAALAAIVARCHSGQRRVQPNALLAATCLAVLLVDPWAALDLGGWLSAAALWGASRFTRWSDRALGTGFWARTTFSSLGATLATAPITAAFLGTVALAGLLLNFPAIPLAALAVPGVLASLFVLPVWPGGAAALAAGSGLGLHLLELSAAAGAALPLGHFLVEAGTVGALLPWVALLGAALWVLAERNTVGEAGRRAGWTATAVVWLGLASDTIRYPSPDGSRGLALHFLDVGQGDGAALRTPGGRWLVIDAGPADERRDAGRRVVAPFLERQGVGSLAAIVVSHAHADHMGGVPALLGRFPVGLLLEPGAPVADPAYAALLTALDRGGVAWHPARAGETFTLDGVRFSVLHPTAGWDEWGEDVNEDSVVLLVEYGDFQALFTGDAGFPAESHLRGRLGQVDLLKVGHHGSRGSTGEEMLDSLRPLAAVISVGRNDYGHPSPEALARLERRGIPVRRTDRDGTVSVTSDGTTMSILSRQGEVTYPVGRRD